MYSSISSHDNVDYESKLSALKHSTSAYSEVGDDEIGSLSVKKKMPKKLIIGVVILLLLGGGAFVFFKKKKKPAQTAALQRPPPAKAKPAGKKKPTWMRQAGALVVLGVIGGIVYGGYTMYKKRKTITI
mgnify:CR=1 FL=1